MDNARSFSLGILEVSVTQFFDGRAVFMKKTMTGDAHGLVARALRIRPDPQKDVLPVRGHSLAAAFGSWLVRPWVLKEVLAVCLGDLFIVRIGFVAAAVCVTLAVLGAIIQTECFFSCGGSMIGIVFIVDRDGRNVIECAL